MRLTYSQTAGTLTTPDGKLFAKGYAGYGGGKNNPAMQRIKKLGPLPQGLYRIIGEPFVHERCGQFCLRLEPDPANKMYGRDGFLWHGDNGHGTASEGCICSSGESRRMAWKLGYREIMVTA